MPKMKTRSLPESVSRLLADRLADARLEVATLEATLERGVLTVPVTPRTTPTRPKPTAKRSPGRLTLAPVGERRHKKRKMSASHRAAIARGQQERRDRLAAAARVDAVIPADQNNNGHQPEAVN